MALAKGSYEALLFPRENWKICEQFYRLSQSLTRSENYTLMCSPHMHTLFPPIWTSLYDMFFSVGQGRRPYTPSVWFACRVPLPCGTYEGSSPPS